MASEHQRRHDLVGHRRRHVEDLQLFDDDAPTGYQYRRCFRTVWARQPLRAATLTVNGTISLTNAPQVTQNPTSQTVALGSSATFTAAATGTPTPTIQWQVLVAGGTTWTNISGATSANLHVYADISTERIRVQGGVTNYNGSATTSAATLTVTVPTAVAPSVTQNPTSQAVLLGSWATFTAAATGTPTPSMMWQVLPTGSGAVWQNLNVTSPSFAITPNILQTGYQFRVMFANSAGVVYSTIATLTVTTGTAPTVTQNPTSETVALGSSATFTAAATGTAGACDDVASAPHRQRRGLAEPERNLAVVYHHAEHFADGLPVPRHVHELQRRRLLDDSNAYRDKYAAPDGDAKSNVGVGRAWLVGYLYRRGHRHTSACEMWQVLPTGSGRCGKI